MELNRIHICCKKLVANDDANLTADASKIDEGNDKISI